ncbi:MAG TPA: hypothetical protein VMU92_11165 [Acidobacteriaceae bacterium]|nr:hypothetical protein [Acidobacteriaceae bacterium]
MTTTRAVISSSTLILLLVLVSSALPAAHAQQVAPNMPPQRTVVPTMTQTVPDNDVLSRRMNEKMAIARNNERQKAIISQSAQLLALAKKLNADASRSNANQLSVTVVKEAAEIEKLAKSIKDKMRRGY